MNDDALADANKQVNGAASDPLLKALHVNSTEKIFVSTPCFHEAVPAVRPVWLLCLCSHSKIRQLLHHPFVLMAMKMKYCLLLSVANTCDSTQELMSS